MKLFDPVSTNPTQLLMMTMSNTRNKWMREGLRDYYVTENDQNKRDQCAWLV